MSEELESGISYAKAIPIGALSGVLDLVDDDGDELAPDEFPDAAAEAGLTDPDAVTPEISPVGFEFDDSGVAK